MNHLFIHIHNRFNVKFLSVIAILFLSFSASGFSIQSSDDVLKLLRESKTLPGTPISKTYLKKNCSEMHFKNSPFQMGWSCKPRYNILKFGSFEYMKSGFTAYTQIFLKVCNGVEKPKRNKCLLDFLEKFTKSTDKKLSAENHSLEFTQEDLEFSMGDLTYSDAWTEYRIISLTIVPKTEVKGVDELGKYLLDLASITGKVKREDYIHLRQDHELEKLNYKFHDFVNSSPKTEYGKKILNIWNSEEKFYNDIISQIEIHSIRIKKMFLKRNNDPIDGKKLNLLLVDIRNGHSEYIEQDVDSLVTKSRWRNFRPPVWLWVFCPVMSILTFIIGSRGPLDILLSCFFVLAPFIGKIISDIGYRSYNKLYSIISSTEKLRSDVQTTPSKIAK